MKKKLTIILLLLISTIGYSQNTFGEIKGKILDDFDNEGILGASVYVKVGDTKFGTVTDINGKYRLKPLNPGTYTLYISYTGKSTIKRFGTLVKPNKVVILEDMILKDSTLKGFTKIWHKIPLIDPEDAHVNTIGIKTIKKRMFGKNNERKERTPCFGHMIIPSSRDLCSGRDISSTA